MTEQEEIDTLRSVSRVFAFSERGEPFKKTFSFEGKTVERMVMEVRFAEYNEWGSLLCKKGPGNDEAWYEYDEHGKKTHSRHGGLTDKGEEFWYDRQGRVVREKDDDGNETWHEYDERGNEIHLKTSDGFEEWHEYDAAGNAVSHRNSDGCEERHEYDEHGREIHRKNSDGYEEWREYDAAGNEVYRKTVRPQGISQALWYDGFEDVDYWLRVAEGKRQHKSRGNDDGEQPGLNVLEAWSEYDERGNIIHRRNSDGYESWFEYNDAGQPLREKHVYPAALNHNAFSAAARSYAKQEREKYEASLPHAAAQKAARDAQDESSDIEEVLYEYDESGRLLSKISDYGAERHEYDERGNETYRMIRRFGRIPPKDNAKETWYEYDDCGRVIRERYRLFERCYDYGTDGMTETIREYYHHSGMERWIEIERLANGKQKRRAEYMAATKKNPDIQLEL